jgi:hypothetical protein
MMEAVLNLPKTNSLETARPSAEKEPTVERVYLPGISWKTYQQLVEDLTASAIYV